MLMKTLIKIQGGLLTISPLHEILTEMPTRCRKRTQHFRVRRIIAS